MRCEVGGVKLDIEVGDEIRREFLTSHFFFQHLTSHFPLLMKNQFFNTGFTLIELLVTIGLIGVLFTVGIASYIDFSRRQIVFQAARKIVQDLRLAQSLAANNQKPDGCGTLDGYTFSIPSTTYEIDVNCSDPAYTNKVREGSVPSDLTLNGFTQVKFKVLRQTLECNRNPCELTVSGFGKSKKVTVGAGGTINIEGE